jgi:hypothetical protein
VVVIFLPDILLRQKTERFHIVRTFYSTGEDEVYLSADSGQVIIKEIWYVADSSGKKRNFKTEVGALNYIGSLGWKIVPIKTEFVLINASKGLFLFRKEE